MPNNNRPSNQIIQLAKIIIAATTTIFSILLAHTAKFFSTCTCDNHGVTLVHNLKSSVSYIAVKQHSPVTPNESGLPPQGDLATVAWTYPWNGQEALSCLELKQVELPPFINVDPSRVVEMRSRNC